MFHVFIVSIYFSISDPKNVKENDSCGIYAKAAGNMYRKVLTGYCTTNIQACKNDPLHSPSGSPDCGNPLPDPSKTPTGKNPPKWQCCAPGLQRKP